MILKPWGYEEVLAKGDGYKVKILTINPGCRTSLQWHKHRKEKLILLQGELLVETKVIPTFTLLDNKGLQSFIERPLIGDATMIARLLIHRLENSGQNPVKILEIQFGEILDDADIERMEDDYGRA